MALTIATAVNTVLNGETPVSLSWTERIWHQASAKIGIIAAGRVVYLASIWLWPSNRLAMPAKPEPGTFTEPGCRWMLFRLVAMVWAIAPEEAESVMQAGLAVESSSDWLGVLLDWPLPPPPEAPSNDDLQQIWARIPDDRKVLALRFLEGLADASKQTQLDRIEGLLLRIIESRVIEPPSRR